MTHNEGVLLPITRHRGHLVDSSSFNCAVAHNERVLVLGRLILGSLKAWRPTGRLEMRKTERNEGDFGATYWGLSGGMSCVLTAFTDLREEEKTDC